jgi:aryl-alcohol dehydrogenase-like predicted oxidoreductase
VPIEESLRGLEEVIRSGKVRYGASVNNFTPKAPHDRYVGISNESPYGIAQYEVGARKVRGIRLFGVNTLRAR